MPYSCYLLYIFCSLRSYRYIKNYPIFKLLIDKYRKIRKLNHFLKYSLGGHRVDFAWTLLRVFRFMDFSVFGDFLKKWTRDLKNGLLEAEKSKTKLENKWVEWDEWVEWVEWGEWDGMRTKGN